jgi:hypothetical protein
VSFLEPALPGGTTHEVCKRGFVQLPRAFRVGPDLSSFAASKLSGCRNMERKRGERRPRLEQAELVAVSEKSRGRYHLKRSEHIPVAALRVVVELTDGIPRR